MKPPDSVNSVSRKFMRRKPPDKKREAQGATADLAQGEATKVPVRQGRSSDHKKDFMRLLNEAARKREQGR